MGLNSRQRRTIYNSTSLLSSICSPSAVTSIEYTFFSRGISLRYLLASLPFPFFPPLLCYISACSVFYLHSLLLSLPTFSPLLATVVIYIQDCPLVSLREECVCVCSSADNVFYRYVTLNEKCWNTFWLFVLVSVSFIGFIIFVYNLFVNEVIWGRGCQKSFENTYCRCG